MNISAPSSIPLAGKPIALVSGTITSPLKVDAKQEFLEYARMSPAERLREQILQSIGVTEDQLAAMEPEARAAVEDEIKRRMMEALKKDSDGNPEPGSFVDMSA